LASDIMLFSSNVLKNNEESYVLQLLPLPEDSKCFNAVPTPKIRDILLELAPGTHEWNGAQVLKFSASDLDRLDGRLPMLVFA
jgi:hypothetical protein